MNRLIRYLFTTYRLTFPSRLNEKVLNFFLEKKCIFFGYSVADGTFSVSTDKRGYHAVSAEPALFGELVFCEKRGLYPHIAFLKKRLGLVLGATLACVILALASSVVWDVRIEGNGQISEDTLKEALADSGLSVGGWIPSLDRRAIMLDMLAKDIGISYLALNVEGNVAYVKVMEYVDAPSKPSKKGGANLVARYDAVIEQLDVRCGEPKVRAGNVVRRGELLVSGITDMHGGSGLVYAEGEVYGRVFDSFTVTVPRKVQAERIVEGKICEISLDFFGKRINIFDKGGNSPTTYGKIYYKYNLTLPNGAKLPFSFTRAFISEKQTEEIHANESETVAYAMRLASERLDRELADAELVFRRLDGHFTEDEYVLVCEYTAIRNIAECVEFGIG